MAYFRCSGKPEEEKTVTAGTSAVTVTPTSGKTMKKVTVNPTPSETKTVIPSTSQQVITPSSGKLLSKVTVNGDADLVAENIKSGVNIFGVSGALESEGLYVWKKCSYTTTPISTSGVTDQKYITKSAQNKAINYYYSTSYTFDEKSGMFVLDNPESGSLPYGSSVSNFPYEYYVTVFSPSSKTMATPGTQYQLILYNDSNGVYFMPYSSSYPYIYFEPKNEYTLINYVVSDNETEYPDGAVHTDGYYYEKVSTELKYTTGTAIYTSNTDINITSIEHGLGEIPKIFYVVASVNSTQPSAFYTYFLVDYFVNRYTIGYGNQSLYGRFSARDNSGVGADSIYYGHTSAKATDLLDSTTAIIGYPYYALYGTSAVSMSNVYFEANVEYRWYAITW